MKHKYYIESTCFQVREFVYHKGYYTADNLIDALNKLLCSLEKNEWLLSIDYFKQIY